MIMQTRNKIKNIVFLSLGLMLLPVANIYAQGEVVIRGIIVDKLDKLPLISASISEIDKSNRVVSGTITNLDGEFALKVKSASNKLVFTYIGYSKQTLDIGNRTTFNIEMSGDNELQEVVITGQKTTNTGSMAIPTRQVSIAMQKIDTKAFEGIQVSSIEDALQGRIGGMDIVSNSGAPGSGMSMRIRGTTSINSNAQPLIVVNGIPFETNVSSDFDYSTAREEDYADLLNVNPDDILDIVILKDAASTAIWGSKGANGVLQINTKKGAMGKPKVQYSYRLTSAYMPDPTPLLNGDQYTMLMKEAYLNPRLDNTTGNIPEYNYQQYPYGDERNAFFWNYNNNTDWVSEITQTAWKHDHNLSLTGGGERGTYRISFGFLDENGIVIGQNLKRFSNRVDLSYKLSDRLFFMPEFAYTYQNNHKNYDSNILDVAMRKMPNTPVYERDKYGNSTDVFFNVNRAESNLHESQRDMVNPVALVHLALNNEKSYRILPVFRLQYDILNPDEQTLRFKSVIALDVNDKQILRYFPKEATGASYTNDQLNREYSEESKSSTINLDNNLTWQPKLPKEHSLMAYLSVQTTMGNSLWQSNTAYWQPNSKITASNQGLVTDLGSGSSEWHSYAIAASSHYAFLERYIADFTLRRDVSSRFGPDNRVGYFPGVSLKWIFSDEALLKNVQFIDLLAVRGSWGQSGTQPNKDYLFYSRYSMFSFNYMDMPAVYSNGFQIENLRWETTTATNLGLDIGLFNGRFNADLNYYHKRTTDLLFPNLAMPGTSGHGSLSNENVGVMDNDGWEVNINAPKIFKIGDFSVDVNMNFANNYNTIVELSDKITPTKGDMQKNGEYLRNIITGNPLGSFYGYRFKGVYQYNRYIPGEQENAPIARDANGNVLYDKNGVPKPMYFSYNSGNIRYRFQGGDAMYEDINHDGSIDELDVVYLGNANPKLQGGFGVLLRYKNFSVNGFFHFRYGNKVVNEARMKQENMYSNDNQSIAVKWRWRTDGDETNMPRALYNTGYNWLGSDRFVEDGSFLRFKYLTFNYSLPKEWIQKYYLADVKLYCTINNLYIWTNYSGVDPEIGYAASKDDPFKIGYDTSKTPRSKDVTFGITVGF
jgi:TonB-linked SusC/RagA family outer membrane protein